MPKKTRRVKSNFTGLHYLWTVKDNQPQLHYEIAALFAESAAFSSLPAAPLAV